MQDLSKKVYKKAQEVLFLDKVKSPREITDIVSSEIYYVLKQYFEIDKSSYNAKIHVRDNGIFDLDFSFSATRILTKKENTL